jgi:uncharacterized protein
MKKSDSEAEPRSPISFHPMSNGEFEPRPVDDRDRLAAKLYRELVDEKSKRFGMTRRQFCESASGMVGALYVMNQAYGCNSGGASAGDAGFTQDAGYDVPADVSANDAAQAAMDTGYDIQQEAVDNPDAADAAVATEEFIFDVQTHTTVPAPPWTAATCTQNTPNMCPTAYLSGIFVDSDTDVACLSGYPAPRASDRPSIQARGKIKEIIDRLNGSPRLVIHANVRPDEGQVELDAMTQDAGSFPVVAWKTYPPATAGRGLDSAGYGQPFLERARQLGIKIVATHRGIGSDSGTWTGANSPRDIGPAAAANPDVKFLVYHSGWQGGVSENHPFNTADAAPLGVDRLIKSVIDNGLGPNSNVYAELGTTWFNLMSNMNDATHVIGKLLKYLGPDRILWGTDSYNNGGPQPQIQAFRSFQIPESMQLMYGYPALTPEVKRKIFGLNAAAVYGIDPQLTRRKLTQAEISNLSLARRGEPAFPRSPRPRPHGPRTWREYLAFLRWSGEA